MEGLEDPPSPSKNCLRLKFTMSDMCTFIWQQSTFVQITKYLQL